MTEAEAGTAVEEMIKEIGNAIENTGNHQNALVVGTSLAQVAARAAAAHPDPERFINQVVGGMRAMLNEILSQRTVN